MGKTYQLHEQVFMPSCQPLFGRKSSKMCHSHFNPALLIPWHHVESGDRCVIRKYFHGRMMRNGEYDDLEDVERLVIYIQPCRSWNIPDLPTIHDSFGQAMYICYDLTSTPQRRLLSNISISCDSQHFFHFTQHCPQSLV